MLVPVRRSICRLRGNAARLGTRRYQHLPIAKPSHLGSTSSRPGRLYRCRRPIQSIFVLRPSLQHLCRRGLVSPAWEIPFRRVAVDIGSCFDP